jgi:hypothetical protein
MANPFYVEPPKLNILENLMGGYQLSSGMRRENEMSGARRAAQEALMGGGDPRSALARLIGAGDIQGANALANFGNQDFDRNYKTEMLGLAKQAATRREEPEDVRKLRAAGMDPSSPEGRKALFPRTDTPVSATDKKAIFEAEDAIPQLQGTLENLNRALELNPKTFSGYTAGLRADIGTKLPGGGALVDKGGALATSEWQKIMGPEALQAMASTLKGATTDFELRKFIEMLGDPATDPKIRQGVIERMKRLTERKLQLEGSRVKELRSGTYFKPAGQAQPASPKAGGNDPLSMARDAIARGADRNAVMQRLQQNGIDPSGL